MIHQLLVIWLGVISLTLARADTLRPLFSATSDAFTGELNVSLTVDQNSNVTGLSYAHNGKETPVSLDHLSKGIVLYQAAGLDAATLSAQNFDKNTGGALTMKYLYSGLNSTYQNFDFLLGRQGSDWRASVLDQNGIPQPFTQMYLKGNRLFGKVIGIQSVSVE